MKRLVAAVIVAIGMIVGLTAPASAGGNSTLPEGFVSVLAGPCGSSYTHVGHYAIPRTGTTKGYLDVYWSSSTERNCLVVNHSGSTYGESLFTHAQIRPGSGYNWPICPSTGCDTGFYRYYAGPVYTPAGVDMSNRCIDINGWVDDKQRMRHNIHCG